MKTDTPETDEALAAILESDGYLSEDNAPEVLVKLCRTMECKVKELNHQLARSQEAGTIWYRRCFGEDAEWQLGELTKLRSALIRTNDAVVARLRAGSGEDELLELLRASEYVREVLQHNDDWRSAVSPEAFLKTLNLWKP